MEMGGGARSKQAQAGYQIPTNDWGVTFISNIDQGTGIPAEETDREETDSSLPHQRNQKSLIWFGIVGTGKDDLRF